MTTALKFLNRCFELAEKGRGHARSNPLVGAVFVHRDQIVSEGFHSQYGGPHAEVNCLERISDKQILEQGILYVSLEPCCHRGKTGACTDLILKKGIKKLIIGSSDFNEEVRGKGEAILAEHGLNVLNYHLEEKQRELNRSFYTHQVLKRPYFICKLALSNDQYIGREGEKLKITSVEMDFWTHKLRAECDAILIGKNTWINDHPRLDARLYNDAKPPIFIVSHNPELFIKSRLDQKILVLNSEITKSIENVDWHRCDIDAVKSISEVIYRLGYRNILLEGGASLIQSFLDANLIDEINLITNESLYLRHGIKIPTIEFSKFTERKSFSLNNERKRTYYRNDLFSI